MVVEDCPIPICNLSKKGVILSQKDCDRRQPCHKAGGGRSTPPQDYSDLSPPLVRTIRINIWRWWWKALSRFGSPMILKKSQSRKHWRNQVGFWIQWDAHIFRSLSQMRHFLQWEWQVSLPSALHNLSNKEETHLHLHREKQKRPSRREDKAPLFQQRPSVENRLCQAHPGQV